MRASYSWLDTLGVKLCSCYCQSKSLVCSMQIMNRRLHAAARIKSFCWCQTPRTPAHRHAPFQGRTIQSSLQSVELLHGQATVELCQAPGPFPRTSSQVLAVRTVFSEPLCVRALGSFGGFPSRGARGGHPCTSVGTSMGPTEARSAKG